MKSYLTILFLTILTASAQNKGDFTFEIEANQIRYNNMDVANRFLRDTTSETSKLFGSKYINDTLKKSGLYGLSLSYQPLNFMSFGIYGSYQSNRFNRTYDQVSLGYDISMNPEFLIGHYLEKVTTSSLTIGASTTVYLNKIFQFEKYNTKFLQRFQIGVGLKGGFSLNAFEIGNGITGMQYITSLLKTNDIPGQEHMNYQTFRSQNWSGSIELKLGYRIVQRKLFSTFGVKIGYQFHSTPVLKDKGDRAFQYGATNEEMKLNFSGLYYGIYLNFGK